MVDPNDGGLSRLVVISTRPDGIITGFNSAAERLLGVSAEKVVGRVTPAVFHDPVEVDRRRDAIAAQPGKVIVDPFHVIVAQTEVGRIVENEWTYLDQNGYRFEDKGSGSCEKKI